MEKIKNFVRNWTERGYEKGEMQVFWLSFFRDVLKVSEPERLIKFEEVIPKGFIDALIGYTGTDRTKKFECKIGRGSL